MALPRGVIYFDVDLAPAATGAYTTTTCGSPSRTVTSPVWVRRSSHHAVPFAAAMSGPANMTATVTANDLDDAYGFMTETLAALDGITGYELAHQLRPVKQAGALIAGGPLTTPARGPR